MKNNIIDYMHATCIKQPRIKVNKKWKDLPFIVGVEYFHVYHVMICGEYRFMIGWPPTRYYYLPEKEFLECFELHTLLDYKQIYLSHIKRR